MAAVVNLQDIVDDLSIMSDVMKSFVDRETGEVVTVAIGDLGAAEEGEEEDVDEAACGRSRASGVKKTEVRT
jgi:hypothetical protein